MKNVLLIIILVALSSFATNTFSVSSSPVDTLDSNYVFILTVSKFDGYNTTYQRDTVLIDIWYTPDKPANESLYGRRKFSSLNLHHGEPESGIGVVTFECFYGDDRQDRTICDYSGQPMQFWPFARASVANRSRAVVVNRTEKKKAFVDPLGRAYRGRILLRKGSVTTSPLISISYNNIKICKKTIDNP